MRRPLLQACAALLFAALAPSGAFAADYAVPVFADAARQERVQALLPEIDAMYKDLAAKEHIPGLVYGIVMDGRLLHVQAIGQADVEAKTPVTPATRFRIASMTKSFVAMALLKLRDEGKLRLDDPAVRYLPELKGVALPTADSPPITIRQLLTMSTGLPEDNPWGDRQMARSNAEIERLLRGGLSFSTMPGNGYEYSNLGYILVGKIVSKVSGMRYQDYVTRHILQPLGMRNTVWEYSAVPSAQLARGYQWVHGAWAPEPILHDGDGAAMGGLITTMDDFSRYVAFLLNAWPARSDAETGPVRRASVREMQQPSTFTAYQPNATTVDGESSNPKVGFYGYGLHWTRDAHNVLIVGHAGGLPGYGSQYRFAPDHGVGVIAFSNLRYGPVYTPTIKALNLLIEKGKLPPRAIPPSRVLAERKEQVLRLLQAWDAQLAESIAAENFFLDRSREDWQQLIAEKMAGIGKIQSIGAIVPENQLRCTFQVMGDKGAIDVWFSLSPEKVPKLQALELRQPKSE
ncbi:serine hydrolase domain-containing protein [Pseudoduganella sp. UC29_106]|uniref:serine hydrolase domain-containing protein n=1 Tax=Pseudoduganella sp. UC29_106 TaxID=3374553 RepID=UPI00375809AF